MPEQPEIEVSDETIAAWADAYNAGTPTELRALGKQAIHLTTRDILKQMLRPVAGAAAYSLYAERLARRFA